MAIKSNRQKVKSAEWSFVLTAWVTSEFLLGSLAVDKGLLNDFKLNQGSLSNQHFRLDHLALLPNCLTVVGSTPIFDELDRLLKVI